MHKLFFISMGLAILIFTFSANAACNRDDPKGEYQWRVCMDKKRLKKKPLTQEDARECEKLHCKGKR